MASAQTKGDGKKSGKAGKVFRRLAGPSERASNTIRLMNRNNSRAIVLFGSFQLTHRRRIGEPSRRASRNEWRDVARL